MHGELAQLVALSAHGAAYLKTVDEAPELYPDATVFRFTNAVTFSRVSRRFGLLANRTLVGQCTAPWYDDLRRRGTAALCLARGRSVPRNRELAPHLEAGFSGGLDVGIVAHFADGERELWSGRWAVTVPEHRERRIWTAEFQGVPTNALYEGPSVEAARRRLGAALEAAMALVAGRAHFDDWERLFRGARGLLDAEAPAVPYHHDLLPSTGYGLGARQLLAASSSSWVFGGMGSWNDVALDDGPAYQSVTTELYSAVLDGVLAATNSLKTTDRLPAR